MYRYQTPRVVAENAARIEAFTYIAATGNLEVIYSVGEETAEGVYIETARKTITLENQLHAAVVRNMTDAIANEVLTMLNNTGKLPVGQSGPKRNPTPKPR